MNTRRAGDVTIIDISGRITLGEGSSTILDKMVDLTKSGTRKILLNLADVSYIDSSCVGELVAGLTSVAKAGGKMKLLNPNKRVRELLWMANLHTVFEVHEDEADAVRSFT